MKGTNRTMSSRTRLVLFMFATMLIVISVLTGIVSFAEYTKSSRAKRVIASYESEGMLFSSNYLAKNGAAATEVRNRYRLFTGHTNTGASGDISICNYTQGNPARPNDSDINYVLSAKLVVVNGTTKRDAVASDLSAGMSVSLTLNGVTKTLSSENLSDAFGSALLRKRVASTDVCNISFSPAFNTDENNVALYIVATPTPAVAGITPIDAIFSTGVSTSQERATWEGYFNESGALGIAGASAPTGFDGFNYTITGSGEGEFKLSWDPSLMSPSQLFLDEIGETVQTETVSGTVWNYIVFDVDSDIISRYDTQFYFAEDVLGTLATWNDVRAAVTYEYTES
ncbi:MAG: hypothetical protein IKN38_08310 [Clostridia bacterium]|nr:hypothetical protein [Clostridia bacterium]